MLRRLLMPSAEFARRVLGTAGLAAQVRDVRENGYRLAASLARLDVQGGKVEAALDRLRVQGGEVTAALSRMEANYGVMATTLARLEADAAAAARMRAGIEAVLDLAQARLSALEAHAGQFRAVYLGGRRVLVRFRHLPLVFIADAADRLIVPHLIQEGEYEKEVTAWLRDNIAENDVCVDVGANIGYHACIMARMAPVGRVLACEPDPDSFALLVENANVNWLEAVLQPMNLALSDGEGQVTLHRIANRSANTSIGATSPDELQAANLRPEPSFVAACTTVDEIVRREEIGLDVMKIDVEGAERLVLRGARRTIAGRPSLRILMEWSPAQLARCGGGAEALLDEIDGQGLAVHRLRLDGTEEPPAARETILESPYWNVVLRHRAA
jgi:FkbM family methyltransferase